MFGWLKRLFCRPRLIERYEDLDAIIEAHNALIQKTITIMSNTSVPPRYVLSRFKAIQDAEEKAIAAYWRNKNRKQDKWYRCSATPNTTTMTGIPQETVQENPPEQAPTTPEVIAAPPTVEVLLEERQSDTQALESKENVIEIHINK